MTEIPHWIAIVSIVIAVGYYRRALRAEADLRREIMNRPTPYPEFDYVGELLRSRSGTRT